MLRRDRRRLENVTYLIGDSGHVDWATRERLLSELCCDIDPDGSVAMLAPRSASSDVLDCIGRLQASAAAQRELRAVFWEPTGT